MITIKDLDPVDGVYVVTETILGWNGDKKTNWYYDVKNMLLSERPDFPEGAYTRKMSNAQLTRLNMWVKTRMEKRDGNV